MRTQRFLLLLLPALLMGAPSAPAQAPVLPVRKVVVYKHGVGYFEREGTVVGDQQLELSFKAGQMKDLLKSLFAIDLSGGRIASISYDTKDPLAKQLEEILIRVPPERALTSFLSGLQGARVRVRIAGREVTGSVLGVEPIVQATPSGNVTTYKLVLKMDDGGIRPVELLDMADLKILDDDLGGDLDRLLGIMRRSKHADRKTVVLHAVGKGERRVKVGYIVETPIWKTTYRLLFEQDGPPLLQGWAILENTTDEDWKDIEVSFVAGSPMSFVMDLYTAYYPERREIAMDVVSAPIPEQKGWAPPAEAREGAPAGRKSKRMLRGRRRDKFDRSGKDIRVMEQAKSLAMELEEEAVASAARGVDVGELFAYEARERVSVPRGRAALVPILTQRLEDAERVLYYRRSFARQPMNACYLKNTTGLVLESGPVTFFDGSTCIGEGLLPDVLGKGMRRMIPYAIEGGVEVEVKVERRSDPVTTSKVVDGVLVLSYTQNVETVYALRNRLQKAMVLYLDHPSTAGYELAGKRKDVEEVRGHYRFRLTLEPGGKRELVVRESRPGEQHVSLLQASSDRLRFHIKQRYLSERVRAFLGEVLDLQSRIKDLLAREAELQQESKRLADDQTRLRKNISVLRQSPEEAAMRARFLSRLEKAETRILEIRSEVEGIRKQLQALNETLRAKVAGFRENGNR